MRINYDLREWIYPSFIQKDLIKNEYEIKAKCIITENPQANSTLDRVHQVTENIVSKFDLQSINLDKDNPLAGTIVKTYFLVQRTHHSMLQDIWCLGVTSY